MNTSQGQFQQAFAQALFDPSQAVHPAVRALAMQPAFAVYRNTVMKACIDALQGNFPTVAQLVGEQWFRAAAALYVATDVPRDGRLLHYGGGFPGFLRGFEPAAELVYLPGVAQLDILWREAHAAQDAPAADAAWIARHTPEQIAALALAPHPAARWAWFDAQPIYAIWERNRSKVEAQEDLPWHGDGALLTRPHATVQWLPAGRADCAFLDACKAGLAFGEAVEQAQVADPAADLMPMLARLLSAGAIQALSNPDTEESP